MKSVNLQFNSCYDCPFIGLAELKIEGSPVANVVAFCKRMTESTRSPQSAFQAVDEVSAAMIRSDLIPEWCPLPEAKK